MKCKLFETKEECIDIIREECTKTILFEQNKKKKKKNKMVMKYDILKL